MTAEYKASLRALSECSQRCKECSKCRIYTADAERAIYYAFGCDAMPGDLRGPISDGMSELHGMAVDALLFELEAVKYG